MEPTQPGPTDALVAALIAAGSVLAQVVAHMHAYHGPGVPEVPIPDALAGVLADVLKDVVARHGDDAIARTAQVVAEATAALAENIVLVPPADKPPPGAPRSGRRPRR